MIYNRLSEIPTHQRIITQLIKSISGNETHHAFLLHGSNGSGKRAIALAFARHFICTQNKISPCLVCPSCIKFEKLQHPDLNILLPVNKKSDVADPNSLELAIKGLVENEFKYFPTFPSKGFYVESIRALKSETKFAATEAPYRVLILFDIEFMNPSSANGFLKLLEEPPDNTVIIMTTNNIHAILQTIISRCLKLQIPLPTDDMLSKISLKMGLPNSEIAIKLSNNSISKTIELSEFIDRKDRDNVLNFLRYSIVLKSLGISAIVSDITSAKNKDKIDHFLSMLSLWFSDANKLLHSENNSHIINTDFKDELKKFTDKYKHINFLEIDELIDQTRKNIISNANASMQLTSLAIGINKNIRAS